MILLERPDHPSFDEFTFRSHDSGHMSHVTLPEKITNRIKIRSFDKPENI